MKALKKYGITLSVGALLTFGIAYSKDVFHQTDLVTVFHILCDAFFVSGTLITSAGLLVFSTNAGTFDMLVYGVQSFVGMFRRNYSRKYETFYDYRVARSEKKVPWLFLVLCGALYLAISFVMYYFYKLYS